MKLMDVNSWTLKTWILFLNKVRTNPTWRIYWLFNPISFKKILINNLVLKMLNKCKTFPQLKKINFKSDFVA